MDSDPLHKILKYSWIPKRTDTQRLGKENLQRKANQKKSHLQQKEAISISQINWHQCLNNNLSVVTATTILQEKKKTDRCGML